MKKLLLTLPFFIGSATGMAADNLADSIRQTNEQHAYIFVSTSMSRLALVELAKEASAANVPLILRGMGEGNLDDTRRKVAEINEICCKKKPVAWSIYPQLFERYKVTQVPSFVLSVNEGSTKPRPEDFVKVTGEMPLSTALRVVYTDSKNPVFKGMAKSIFERSFAQQ